MSHSRESDASKNDMVAMRAALSDGRITADLLVERAIARAEAVNPQLNFIAWRAYGRARAQARASCTGPLTGMPTLIKDMITEKGLPASWGAMALRDYIAAQDAPYTQAIANAGLISIARTSMPELGLNVVTESPLVGATRNPWSLAHSPGGSSGGSAAAVAAGVVPIAHGSDGLGSIRHGAAPCGLVGLKPSRGRNFGDEKLTAITDLNVNGCISRSVRDTAAWFDATQSRDPSAPFEPAPLVVAPIESALRIHAYSAIMRTGAAPDASVSRVFAETVACLERLGHQVRDGQLAFNGPRAVETLQLITEGMFARRLGLLSGVIGIAIAPEDLEPRSASLVVAGQHVDEAVYRQAWTHAGEMVKHYVAGFDAFDVWMTPTFGAETVRIGVFGPDTSWPAQKDQLVDYAGYCWIDNFAGTPSISLPMGFSDNGLPIGMQFATRPGDEPLLLALALQIENVMQWQRSRPPIWVGDD